MFQSNTTSLSSIGLMMFKVKTCKMNHSFEGLQCKVCRSAYQKEYQRENAAQLKSYKKKYNAEHAKEIAATNKKYRQSYNKENKETITIKQKNYVRAKSQTDIVFRLAKNLRSRTSTAMKNEQKAGSAVADLGCSGADLKKHLESLFEPGMNWDNYGNKNGQWSIDHIIPLSKVDLTNREEFLKVSHYTNLQPMWQILNVKKSNKFTC